MGNRRLAKVILSVLVVAVAACSSIGQKPDETIKPEGSAITIKGRINYMKDLGGYSVRGDAPAKEYIIMNENLAVLEELFTSGKTVTIEGRMDRGADYLFIEKINGKEYLNQMIQ